MDNLTIVIPYYNGGRYLPKLLDSIPKNIPIIVVDDQSDVSLFSIDLPADKNLSVFRPDKKGYFTGAVNFGIKQCDTDVLVLNQDVELYGTEWLDLIEKNRSEYALIGERIKGTRKDFPFGYVHGVFMFMRRDAINEAGLMDEKNYPLWGSTALWQWQVCRKGYKALPIDPIPGLVHKRSGNFGSSIRQLLEKKPKDQYGTFIRVPPEISVIIPCYNHGKYLEDAINSLIGGQTDIGYMEGQTFQSFEIIVVNDASTDNTDEVAKRICDPWKGIRYIKLPKNRGTAGAYNAGIREATGKYITCMSADDMRESWGIEALYREIVRNPTALVYDNYRKVRNGVREEILQTYPYDFDLLLNKNMVPTQVMFSKSSWEAVGGYPENFGNGREDWAFAIAMGRQGYCGIKIDSPGYLYRRHEQNRTLRNTSPEWMEYFKQKLRQTFPDVYGGRYPMACCGKKNSSNGLVKTSQMTGFRNGGTMAQLFPDDGTVILEYTGGNVGSQKWGGPKLPSKRAYVFGNNERDRQKLVDVQDKDWFLARQDSNGSLLFREVQPPKTEEPKEPEEVQDSEQTVSETQVLVESQEDETNQALDEVAATIAKMEGEEDWRIDPSEFTISEVKDMNLSNDQAAYMYGVEKQGKNRVGILNHLEDNYQVHAQVGG